MSKISYSDQIVIIGEYTLGLLERQENADTQKMLSGDATAARCALSWESNFLELVDALPAVTPPQALLSQILTTLDLPSEPGRSETLAAERQLPGVLPDAQPEASSRPDDGPARNQILAADIPVTELTRGDEPDKSAVAEITDKTTKTVTDESSVVDRGASKTVWLGGGVAGVLFVAVLALAFFPMQPAEPPITIVEVAPTRGAILQAPGQSSTPGWVVTIDIDGNVLLTPKVHTDIPSDASVQLWTYSKTLSQPRSLGLINPNQPVAVPSTLIGEIGEDQYFEMTLEPEGGAPASEPSGPVLFIGRVVTFGE